MGVTDVFNEGAANFSEITGDVPIFLTAANQSVRVQIDEEGVKAAAYIEFPGATSPEPPKEIIDFILDRPLQDGRSRKKYQTYKLFRHKQPPRQCRSMF